MPWIAWLHYLSQWYRDKLAGTACKSLRIYLERRLQEIEAEIGEYGTNQS